MVIITVTIFNPSSLCLLKGNNVPSPCVFCDHTTGGNVTNVPRTYPQWVNSVPPYVRKLHFMYEVIRTSGKYRWNIYRTSSKRRWSIYRTSRKRRGTFRIVHKVERSSPTVIPVA